MPEQNTEQLANQFNRITAGNPGAMSVLFQLRNTGQAEVIDMVEMLGWTGPEIWMVYKDEEGENINRFASRVREAIKKQ